MDNGNKKSGSRETSKKGSPLGLVIALAIGAVIGSAVTYSLNKPQAAAPQTTSSPVTDQLPRTMTLPPQQQQFAPAPQPPGAVPPGKVWSAEHGHWHDAPGGLTIPAPSAAPTENK